MPEIGRLDGNFLLVSVTSVPSSGWVTDKSKKIVRLPDIHDMREKIGQYYYDFDAECFMPKQDVSDVLDDVIDSLVSIITDIADHMNVKIGDTHTKTFSRWNELKRQ